MLLTYKSLSDFAHHHDEIPAFHAVFLTLTFLAAAMLNLGAFGLLILAHMTLDFVKYREVHHMSYRDTFAGMMHESLIDITLFFAGLVFSVYFHHSVGVAHVSGLLRAEFTIVRFVGVMIPKLVILEGFLKIISHIHHYMQQIHPALRKGWSRTDKLYVACILFCIGLLFFAGSLMNVDASVIRWIILWELVPWNI